MMQRHKVDCPWACAPLVAMAIGGPVMMSGCDSGGSTGELAVPAQPPSVTSKESMQNFLDNVPKKGAKAAKK